VQVGGVNVFPERVREVLKRHPAVADAAVRLMRPGEGTRLKAFVVPKVTTADGEELGADLRAWMEQELTAPERPKAIRLGPALPVGSAGKSTDWAAHG
jgi:acyl-coenzyme A synthetase/AMP-(fatty) acid ligase